MSLAERSSRYDRALAAVVLGSAVVYAIIVSGFFPDGAGLLGDDYEYFLPTLLAGKYWVAQNGLFAMPRFTPAFCGGLPLLANPQSVFYSLPQALALVADPVASLLVTTLVFAGIGSAGTYALLRRRFGASAPAAALSAVIFLFNGFLLHRMAAGHLTYHVFGLVPPLCYALLTPLESGAGPRRLVLRRTAGTVAAAAAILAYFVYAGAPNILVPLGMTCVAVWLLHALIRPPVASFWLAGFVATAIAAAAAAAKLAPAVVFLHYFPRTHELMLFDNPLYYGAVFAGFFLPSFLPDQLGFLDRHELEFGVGLVPFLLLLAAYDRRRAIGVRPRRSLAAWTKLAALVLVLAVPIALNCGVPAYATWLKSLPYIGNNVILVRWFYIYLMPLIIGAGLALDFVFPLPAQRSRAALAGVLVTVLQSAIDARPVYAIWPYDPSPIVTADQMLRSSGVPPAIGAIGGPGVFSRRDDGLVEGQSSFPCYEALFGYHLEDFPPRLELGPVLSKVPGGRHLRNPACYIYGPENGCVPGATFTLAERQEERAFAAYRPFAFVLPFWQSAADWLSASGLAMIVLVMGVALFPAGHQRSTARAASSPAAE
jgi:hypothetical protein